MVVHVGDAVLIGVGAAVEGLYARRFGAAVHLVGQPIVVRIGATECSGGAGERGAAVGGVGGAVLIGVGEQFFLFFLFLFGLKGGKIKMIARAELRVAVSVERRRGAVFTLEGQKRKAADAYVHARAKGDVREVVVG